MAARQKSVLWSVAALAGIAALSFAAPLDVLLAASDLNDLAITRATAIAWGMKRSRYWLSVILGASLIATPCRDSSGTHSGRGAAGIPRRATGSDPIDRNRRCIPT